MQYSEGTTSIALETTDVTPESELLPHSNTSRTLRFLLVWSFFLLLLASISALYTTGLASFIRREGGRYSALPAAPNWKIFRSWTTTAAEPHYYHYHCYGTEHEPKRATPQRDQAFKLRKGPKPLKMEARKGQGLMEFVGPCLLDHHLNDSFYESSAKPVSVPFIQLNQVPTRFARHLWASANPLICVDGGANQLYDNSSGKREEVLRLPTHIIGDLDSIRKEVLQAYASAGVHVTNQDHNQDTNDFEKALRLIESLIAEGETHDCWDPKGERFIVVDGALGGRLDHQLVNLNILLQYQNLDIVLISEASVAFLLRPGEHRIRRNAKYESKSCGITSLAGIATNVVSKGLKWELDGVPLGFGRMVSGSNEFMHNEVIIRTDVPLLWISNLYTKEERKERDPVAWGNGTWGNPYWR